MYTAWILAKARRGVKGGLGWEGGGWMKMGNPHVKNAEMFFLFYNSLRVGIFQEKEKKILDHCIKIE